MQTTSQLGRHTAREGTRVLAAAVLLVAFASALAASAQAPPAADTHPVQPQTAIPSAPPPQASTMPSVPGTELDRVVAIVNGDLILDSDVDEERRFAAFDPYRESTGGFTRDKAIERLINRDLIQQQIKLQPEDQIPDADVTKQIDELRKTIPACQRYHCETKQGWDRFLAEHGFTEATFFARWRLRMEMLQFISERFQTGLRITPEQIRSFYEKTMLPEYARQHATPPKLDAISGQIEQVLVQQQISNLLVDWLKSLRAQGSVVVLHPGEEAP